MAQGSRGRVLVVHDEPSFTATLERAFQALGFSTDAAIDCQNALRLVARTPPDIVCVSLSLPRDSGYDLCERIRADRALDNVRILVISDRSSPEVAAYAEEAGANAFLERPFKLEALARCTTDMLEMRSVRRASPPRRRQEKSITME